MNTKSRRIAINVGGGFVPGMNAVVAAAGTGVRPGRLASGTYYYRFEAGSFSETMSMVLVK